MKKRCEECNSFKEELPFWVEYLDKNMNIIEERKTCYDCRFGPVRQHRVIGVGPYLNKNKKRYQRVHIVGKPFSDQLELF